MTLVEERDDFVARLEASDVGPNGYDCASTVGPRNDGVTERKGILALRNDEIAVVERGALDWWTCVSRVTRATPGRGIRCSMCRLTLH